MIRIDERPADAADAALEAPGGFVWWYLDLVGPDGDGVVVIWSFGLPFLPGYAGAAREGRAPRPVERPSLNVAVYDDAELDCYLLQEYAPEDVEWSDEEGSWTFGRSRFRVDSSGGRMDVAADLDCEVPGGDARLTGTVRATGTRPRATDRGDHDEPHTWVPMAVPADGAMELAVGDEASYRAEGRAYVDHNRGTRPLHDLGIRQWHWGRAELNSGELVFYRLESDEEGEVQTFGHLFREDGEVNWMPELRLELEEASRNIGGLRWWQRWRLRGPEIPGVRVDCRDVVDSGPFYMRYLTRTEDESGHTARGMGELIRPDRIDEGLFRPLVKMRVDRSQREEPRNSMWLPLFTGPKSGRLRRFLRHNTGAKW